MRPTGATVTAAAALAVAAVTAVSASVALATGEDAQQVREFSAPIDGAQRVSAAPPLSAVRASVSTASVGAASQAPRRVAVPALGVDAPVLSTGVTKAGNAEIPTDGDVVGWYEFGAAPGDRQGSAVFVGHRDTRAEGPGALFNLDTLQQGDSITVDRGHRILRYQVVALRSTEKAGLPAALFRRTGPHQLVLITCGGAYLPAAGGYQENLFAVAVPRGDSR